MGNARDNELSGDIVGKVVVRGEDDNPVVVVAFEEVVECVEFLVRCASNAFGTLLCDKRSSALWVVGRTFEKLRIALLFPEVEVVTVDVISVELLLVVVLSPFLAGEFD